METPTSLKFTKDHEWVSPDGKVGVSDYAQHELGDVVFVELPKAGREVKKGQEICVLESVKAVSNVYSPVSGKIEEINSKLSDAPELVNKAPYSEGWIARIAPSDKSELTGLMGPDDYKKYIDGLHSTH